MHANTSDVLTGLSAIENQVDTVRAMVEKDTYCVDILRQTYEVRKAIEALEQMILNGHLQGCVPEGLKEGKNEAVLQELLQLYSLVGNR
jgi:DNA-binding FrmR family transcriptional regulator